MFNKLARLLVLLWNFTRLKWLLSIIGGFFKTFSTFHVGNFCCSYTRSGIAPNLESSNVGVVVLIGDNLIKQEGNFEVNVRLKFAHK